MILKREGVLAGVADLFLSEPSGDYHGLYVEMKTDKGKQSDHQVIFEHKATGLGYKYVVCKSLDSFMDEVRSYLNG